MDDSSSAASSKPTQTPSWVMLGFVVGVLFMLALPRREPAPSQAVAPLEPLEQAAPAPPAPPNLATIEAVFAQWGKYAVWDNDATEVMLLWDPDTRSHSECYEVFRVGDAYFFRSIPQLTRPVLTHGLPEGAGILLQFTETAAQRQEWLQGARDENLRAFSESLRGGGAAGAKPKAAP